MALRGGGRAGWGGDGVVGRWKNGVKTCIFLKCTKDYEMITHV